MMQSPAACGRTSASSCRAPRRRTQTASGWSSCRTSCPPSPAGANITVEQINLAAFGLKFPGLNPIIGPFQVVDFRAYLTQNLVNINALESYIAIEA